MAEKSNFQGVAQKLYLSFPASIALAKRGKGTQVSKTCAGFDTWAPFPRDISYRSPEMTNHEKGTLTPPAPIPGQSKCKSVPASRRVARYWPLQHGHLRCSHRKDNRGLALPYVLPFCVHAQG
jgi:hypothetical protein